MISVATALENDPGYTPGWSLAQNGPDWTCSHPKYGWVGSAVVADDKGKPLFDRPMYSEAPHIITVVWAEDGTDIVVGLILEDRPHGGGLFWGVPRGFQKPGEDPEAAARREAGEEAGAAVVLQAKLLGYVNPNPTFVRTDGPVIALKVQLNRLEEIRPGRNEKIYKVTFFALGELFELIARNETHEGGRFADGVSLAALLLFMTQVRSLAA